MKSIITLLMLAFVASISNAQKLPGTADSTFNSNGYNSYEASPNKDHVETAALGTDGKLWLAGYSADVSYNMTFARVLANGKLDNTFKNNGIGSLDFSPNGTEIFRDIMINSTGKMFGVGVTEGPVSPDVIVVKTDENGVLDTTFGSKGVGVYDLNGGFDDGMFILEDKNGKIVVAGMTENANKDLFILRLNANGTVDSSFNGDGIAEFNSLNVDNQPAKLLERPLGGYYLVGNCIGNSDVSGDIISVSNNGNLNIDLGGPGKLNFKIGAFKTGIYDAAIHNNSIFIAGTFIGANANEDGFVSRIGFDGKLNSSFGSAGIMEVIASPANITSESLISMQIASDSSIFLAGYFDDGNTQILTVKLKIDGSKDPFFGKLNGLHTFSLPDVALTGFDVNSCVLDEMNQRLYVVGTVNHNGNQDFYVFASYTAKTTGTLGLEKSSVQNLNVYPNPNAGILNFGLAEFNVGEVQVFNSQGQLVLATELKNELELTSNLQNGVYFIQVNTENKIYRSKIVLQR